MQHLSLSKDYLPFIEANNTKASTSRTGLITKFSLWLKNQEKNRLFWLGIAILGGIGTVLPLTLLAVVFFAGNSFTLWVLACVINVPVLILNLAAQPPRITLPVLFFAWTLDAIIIAYSLFIFLVA